MIRTLFFTAITFATICIAPARAEQSCKFIEDSPENCSRFVGCINTDGSYFYGKARGWQNGALIAVNSNKETCTGTWSFQSILEKGEGHLSCPNGEEGRLTFFTRDGTTNNISGLAITNKGNRLLMWASTTLPEYLAQKFPNGDHPGFQCGDTWIKYPDSFPD